HIMGDLVSYNGAREERLREGRTIKQFAKAAAATVDVAEVSTAPSPVVQPLTEIPKPAFYGVRARKDFDLREIFEYINELALFKNQWQLKTASASDYQRMVEEKFKPILRDLKEEVIQKRWFEPKAVYGFFACQSDGNDVVIYDSPAGSKELLR